MNDILNSIERLHATVQSAQKPLSANSVLVETNTRKVLIILSLEDIQRPQHRIKTLPLTETEESSGFTESSYLHGRLRQ